MTRACSWSPSSTDDVEDREPDGRRDGIAAERVEVLHPVGERVGDRSGRGHRAERVAVADRLAHRHDVRRGALGPEGPDVPADSAEPDLDLVGDRDGADAAGSIEQTGEPAADRSSRAPPSIRALLRTAVYPIRLARPA